MRETRVGCIEQRFFSRFKVDEETGCWDWTGPPNSSGYGMISGAIGGKRYVPKGGRMLAHRVSWIIHHGPIPEGEGAHGTVVMHTCDNRRCVNPKHLRLGTQTDNVRDMRQKGRAGDETRIFRSGVAHHNAVIKDPEAIALIRSTERNTKALAEKFGVGIWIIKNIRSGRTYAK